MSFRIRCLTVVTITALAATACLEAAESEHATFTISGSVGLPGVRIRGLPGSPSTDDSGRYRAMVPRDWSGTVTPTRAGYRFAPASRQYTPVKSDLEGEDYTPSILTFAISGNVGLGGVALQGLPGDPITDAGGNYAAQVSYGWVGTIAPKKEGYAFDPPRRTYSAVTADQTNQDYMPRVLTLTVSDRIVLGDEPIQGVAVSADPGGASDVTDAQGRYNIEVPYGWTGKLTIAKEGYTFYPPSKSFAHLTTHVIDGVAERPTDLTSGRRSLSSYASGLPSQLPSSVLLIPTVQVEGAGFTEMGEDLGVMLHILREKLSEPQTIMGVLSDYGDYFGAEGRQARAFYIQGYGILFVMEVDFPLPAPSGVQVRAEPEPARTVDPVWQRARDKLYAPRAGVRQPVPETHRKTFDQFKDDLLNMLKHAANIRHVDPNEKVILTVTFPRRESFADAPLGFRSSSFGGSGGYVAGGSTGGFSARGGSLGAGGGFRSESYGYVSGFGAAGSGRRTSADPAMTSSSTVLTMQVRKADIDAFARGELNFEQFRDKVKAFAY